MTGSVQIALAAFRIAIFTMLIAPFGANHAGAQTGVYPERPIRFVVGFGQGGPTDILARVLAEELTHRLKQNVYVENRPGASGNIATQTVASAQPDGYTFLIGASPLAVNRWLFPEFQVLLDRDIVALAPLGATANALVVHPSLGVKDLRAFIALAKEKPEFITYATLGRGSSSHLAGVAFDAAAQTKLIAVPYRGNGEALQDLMGQHVKAWFATLPSVLEQVRAGQLIALATTGPERSASLPHTPTIAEHGFGGYDVRLWVGVFAHAGVAAERLDTIGRSIEASMASDRLRQTLEAQGVTPLRMNRAAFASFVRAETSRWEGVVASMPKEPKPAP